MVGVPAARCGRRGLRQSARRRPWYHRRSHAAASQVSMTRSPRIDAGRTIPPIARRPDCPALWATMSYGRTVGAYLAALGAGDRSWFYSPMNRAADDLFKHPPVDLPPRWNRLWCRRQGAAAGRVRPCRRQRHQPHRWTSYKSCAQPRWWPFTPQAYQKRLKFHAQSTAGDGD